MTLIKKLFIIGFSVVSVVGILVGVSRSLHSKLFVLKKVEVVRTGTPFLTSPLDDQALIRLASIAVGKVGLYDLDIRAVQRQLISQEWIREVRLQKKFPDTLVMSIILREPKAILQTSKGGLVYVDSTGIAFGFVNLMSPTDLPMLTGFTEPAKIKEALQLLSRWERSDLNHLSWISSIAWEQERGYRLLVAYPMSSKGNQNRAMIDLGQDIDDSLDGKIFRLTNVIRYLSGKSIATRQIWADAGKKVVVKTSPGS